MGLDERIGNKFLHAGPGYGGSCFPKDTKALVETGKEFKSEMELTKTVIKVNENIKKRMVNKIVSSLEDSVKDKKITILGVTFKPNTDDMREAPSTVILPALIKKGAILKIVDPQGYREGNEIFGKDVEWLSDIYEAVRDSELIVILTEWNQFRALNLLKISKLMKKPRLVDLRNIYSEEEALSNGFIFYDSVGRRNNKN